jgi:hypothetical protein
VLNEQNATQPFRIGLWTPFGAAGYFIDFNSGLDRHITADSIVNGMSGSILRGGNVFARADLGTYELGRTYGVSFLVDKIHGLVSAKVSTNQGDQATASTNARAFPDLFSGARLSLTASSEAGDGTSMVAMSRFQLNLPHQRFWASKVDDPVAHIALVGIAIAGVLLLALTIGSQLTRWLSALSETIRAIRRAGRSGVIGREKAITLVVASVAVYLAGNALLFRLGGHPFDISAEKLYAYTAQVHGSDQLYYLPNLVSLAWIWHGTPFQESGFPYEPVFAYLAAAIGWINSQLFAGGGSFRVESSSLEYLIKAVNVGFGLADAALIFFILRAIKSGERWSLIGAGLFLFNPAVWFSMSVWGQTHVISLFFVLAAVWFAEKNRPLAAWIALTTGCLTRPQMLVFGLLLGIAFLKKFSWQRNVIALSWTVVLTFLALIPLTLATSPSLPVDVMLNNFHIQQAGGNDAALTTVSQGAFSIWPLVTYLIYGASGLTRTFIPSSEILVGPLTYQSAGLILTIAALLILSVALLLRKRSAFESGGYIPFVTLGVTSFLMLLTGIVSTHFLLALPFLLMCRRWMSSVAYFYVAIIWTITTFVAMYGEMGLTLASLTARYPLLSPTNNEVTRLVVSLYTWDRFITVAVVADICAVVWLAVRTFRRQVPLTSSRTAAV